MIVGIIAPGIGKSALGSKQSTSSVGSSAITSMLIYSSSFSSPSKYILLPLTQAM
nr:MAG TPA: NACHT domain protein [Caudoviricetes sp.]